jgi:hypothetical protein
MNRRAANRRANALQRALPLLLFIVIAAMIWVAHSGRYDHAINHVANWLHRHVDAIVHWR